MCLGEAQLDTMAERECASIRVAAADHFPDHVFGIKANEDGQQWVVLEPNPVRSELLRFTICRISPCVMVMAEDATGRRQICSTATVDEAMAYARNTADAALLARANAHPAHRVLQ